jgi:hypothetical protein
MLRPYKGSITNIKKIQPASIADAGFYISQNHNRKGEMKMNFAETVAGQRFLNHDFPSLVKSAERIAKAMEEQNKTAAKPYLLISVLDREITAEQFPSLEAAQAQMLAEIAQTGVADANNLHIGDCYDDFEIHEDNAWANHHGDNDWKIVELEVK